MLGAKARALAAAAAQLTARQSADLDGGGQLVGQVDAGQSTFVFPLQVRQRTTLVADLGHSGWLAALEAAGWDRKVCPLRRLLSSSPSTLHAVLTLQMSCYLVHTPGPKLCCTAFVACVSICPQGGVCLL